MENAYVESAISLDKAKKALEKMKLLEEKYCKHTATLTNGAVVCCKNEDRIKQYKKLK